MIKESAEGVGEGLLDDSLHIVGRTANIALASIMGLSGTDCDILR